MPHIHCHCTSMPDVPSSTSSATPAAPSFKPAKRRRRRGRRRGKKNQIKMQQDQHSEVVDRLDQIRVLLQATLHEIIGTRLDRRNPPTDTHSPGQSDSRQVPFSADSVKDSVGIDPDKIAKLAESFFLLEMELNLTRDRLHNLRALVGPTTDGYLRARILELVDSLMESIDLDLARLCIITQQQFDAGLTDHAPPMNGHPDSYGGPVSVCGSPYTDFNTANMGSTACGTPRSEDDRSPGFWEVVDPDLSSTRPGITRPVRTWRD
ncbi:hypothetical protein F4861DRAFT_498293 [Xylaria intraflava]|nr:hypothetical protein F4861DRAFT_498293 [Xylaria intraflava]